jgi:hypothetical protein
MSALKASLEKLMDCEGLRRVLEGMAEVCAEKADHIRTNWQSKELARDWDEAGTLLDKAAAKVRTP